MPDQAWASTPTLRRTVATVPKEPMHRDMDERVALPLDPETALKALLEVDPDDPDADDEGR